MRYSVSTAVSVGAGKEARTGVSYRSSVVTLTVSVRKDADSLRTTEGEAAASIERLNNGEGFFRTAERVQCKRSFPSEVP